MTTERPILFSGPMVRAILDGRKTQTRRAVKPRPVEIVDGIPYRNVFEGDGIRSERRVVGTKVHRSPYGQPGDRLWVRETWGGDDLCGFGYRADQPDAPRFPGDGEQPDGPWRPSIFMPRLASRITLEVIGVGVERLQNISYEDAVAEGMNRPEDRFEPVTDGETFEQCARRLRWPQRSFELLWDRINAKRCPWASNPWVWTVEFTRV